MCRGPAAIPPERHRAVSSTSLLYIFILNKMLEQLVGNSVYKQEEQKTNSNLTSEKFSFYFAFFKINLMRNDKKKL